MAEKKIKVVNEKIMLCYFLKKSKEMKSLWCEYSKLKCMIYINHKVNISQFINLFVFLKRKTAGNIAKKSKILTRADFKKFLLEADGKQYLLVKVKFRFSLSIVHVFIFVNIVAGSVDYGHCRCMSSSRTDQTNDG